MGGRRASPPRHARAPSRPGRLAAAGLARFASWLGARKCCQWIACGNANMQAFPGIFMNSVLILGAGKIGALISGLLGESGAYQVQMADVDANRCRGSGARALALQRPGRAADATGRGRR